MLNLKNRSGIVQVVLLATVLLGIAVWEVRREGARRLTEQKLRNAETLIQAQITDLMRTKGDLIRCEILIFKLRKELDDARRGPRAPIQRI